MIVKIIGGHGGVSPGFKATSYLIDHELVIDAGSCASAIPIEEQKMINHILISHCHLDHIKDLAFICDNCFGLRPEPFLVHSNKTVIDAIKTHLLNDIIWPDFTKLPTKSNPVMQYSLMKVLEPKVIGNFTVTPVNVNHPGDAMGFIIEKGNKAIVFTQDTGPTDQIWQLALKAKNLKAIFTEVSFPNELEKVAIDSQHHTPASLQKEIQKMPKDVPIFVGHLKPNYQTKIYEELNALKDDRIQIMGMDDASFVF